MSRKKNCLTENLYVTVSPEYLLKIYVGTMRGPVPDPSVSLRIKRPKRIMATSARLDLQLYIYIYCYIKNLCE